MLYKYFYKLIYKYYSLYLNKQDRIIEINSENDFLEKRFKSYPFYKSVKKIQELNAEQAEVTFIILNGNLHYESDVQTFLENIHAAINFNTRIIVTYYSSLWKPFFRLATFLKLRVKTKSQNWLTHEDIENFFSLSGFEIIRKDSRVLIPVYIPLFSNFVNRFIAPLPFFKLFTMINIAIARPLNKMVFAMQPSVSIVIPARNEAGNIENAIKRFKKMGPDDELIFIEGNSSDNTWEVIQQVYEKYKHQYNIKIDRQTGKGKGDAVRKGFSIATKEILMILDADLTVPPEELYKFYNAIKNNRGEFINGSRLVYPMDQKAMRFFNMIGNKFFAMAFSFIIGQRFKDTLCGTKVISRKNYDKLAANRAYFGEFDPFGDFDLLFGASRLGLKIIEIPITYRERTYGDTNIARWTHGLILLKMAVFAARKIKFI